MRNRKRLLAVLRWVLPWGLLGTMVHGQDSDLHYPGERNQSISILTPESLASYLSERSDTLPCQGECADVNYDEAVNVRDLVWVRLGWNWSIGRNFDYRADAPLNLIIKTTSISEGIKTQNVTYDGEGGPVVAILVTPPGDGPFAGVIFMHWGLGNQSEFLSEAKDLAARGVLSLLLTMPWRRPGSETIMGTDGEVWQIVTDARRGIDLMIRQLNVDPSRIAYVGHSYGASRGGVLTGVERRFQTLILMAGYPQPSETEPNAFLTAVSDGIHYCSHAHPASLLFQFAEHDYWISIDQGWEYFNVASEPKSVLWYDTDHGLNLQARADRLSWLQAELDLH